jgi:hypothetical protein
MSKRFIATLVGAVSIALSGAALAAPDGAGKSGTTPAATKPAGDVGAAVAQLASSSKGKGKGHCKDDASHSGGGKGHDKDCPASP